MGAAHGPAVAESSSGLSPDTAMLGSLLLLLVMADTEIHRCRAADGTVAFQDRPCAQATTAPAPRGGPSTAPVRNATPMPRHAPPAQGVRADERVLAACSERFLHCAHGNDARMDACVAAIRTCPAGGAPCCPSRCIQRYQDLRRQGEARSSAVRLALLDPDSPSCAAPGSGQGSGR
jgi:hypothetical protein